MKNLKAIVSALALAGLLTACGTAAADIPPGPSETFSGGGPDVRGGNHEAVEAMTTTTVAPTTTSTTEATTTTVAPTTTQAPTTTVAPTAIAPTAISDDTINELGESICGAFDGAYLNDMVDVVLDNVDGTTEDAIVLVGMGIAAYCPDKMDMFIDELEQFYPEYAPAVAERMVVMLEEAAA